MWTWISIVWWDIAISATKCGMPPDLAWCTLATISLSQAHCVLTFPWLGRIGGSSPDFPSVLRRPMKVWRSMSLPMPPQPPTVFSSMSFAMCTWSSWSLASMVKLQMKRSWRIERWQGIFCTCVSIGPCAWCILCCHISRRSCIKGDLHPPRSVKASQWRPSLPVYMPGEMKPWRERWRLWPLNCLVDNLKNMSKCCVKTSRIIRIQHPGW